jgi:hypothetical protein
MLSASIQRQAHRTEGGTMDDSSQKPGSSPNDEQAHYQGVAPTKFKNQLGSQVVYFGLVVVAALGVVALLVTKDDPVEVRFQHVKDILAILLPVIAAWVGTVLAFYFGRENFATASDKAMAMVKQMTPEQKLESIEVKSAMIPMDQVDKLVLDQTEKEVLIKDHVLNGPLATGKRNRLPIIDPAGCVKYVLHRSMFDRFVSECAMSGAAPDLSKLTLADVVAKPPYSVIAISFGAVGPDANLRAAKQQMDGNPNCSDVVVTEDGSKNTRAIGWITNVIVAEKAKV